MCKYVRCQISIYHNYVKYILTNLYHIIYMGFTSFCLVCFSFVVVSVEIICFFAEDIYVLVDIRWNNIDQNRWFQILIMCTYIIQYENHSWINSIAKNNSRNIFSLILINFSIYVSFSPYMTYKVLYISLSMGAPIVQSVKRWTCDMKVAGWLEKKNGCESSICMWTA